MRSTSSTKPELEPEPVLVEPLEVDPVVDADVDELDEEDEELALVPPALTLWPRVPLTLATVPADGARSTVSARVRRALARLTCAWRTLARS